jgi:hypothetical protein
MKRLARRARGAVTIAVVSLGALSASVPFAGASTASPSSTVPFKDPNIQGWLTFCNRDGQRITSGNLYTVPFVWKAISSAPAPAGYRTSKGRATLYAYQPIQYVDPGSWAGGQLTYDSAFSNPNHPVAQATNADLPLIGFTQAFPLHWDGLAEIRMMWTGVNMAQITTPYAAAIIRVTGDTWTLVQGGNASCNEGKGISMETIALSKKKLAKPESATPGGKTTPHGKSSPSSAGAAGQSGGSGPDGRLAADSSPAGGLGAGALAGIVVAALAAVWGGIILISRLRRRTAS